jgi:uncharacterized protein (DUF1697 family)
VIFATRARDLAALERRIEARLQAQFGFEITTFIRTENELAANHAHAAFEPAALAAARTHVVGFLADAADAAARQAIAGFESADYRFHLDGRELHWLSTLAQSESTFSNTAFERALRGRATFRSITTLRKLAATLG